MKIKFTFRGLGSGQQLIETYVPDFTIQSSLSDFFFNNLFLKDFVCVWTIFKVFIEFVTILLLFYVLVFLL